MRVSTAQFFYQSSYELSKKQSDINEQIAYVSSGKRVLTAKDDAVNYSTLAGYNDELNNINKYQRNITQAENRNGLLEVSFSTATNIMQELKQRFIQANNGTLAQTDLNALSDLAEDSLDQLLNIANTKDETGGYIFSGFQIGTEPFALQPDNSVIYQGDTGIRELQIAKNVMVETNQSGFDAFQKVPNANGDFSPTYNINASNISVNKAIIVNPGGYDDVTTPPNYNFNFTSPTDLTVTDSLGAVIFNTAAYVPGQVIAFNGMEVQVSGNPLPGDNFDLTPQENISVFETIKGAIEWMRTPEPKPNGHQVDYEHLLSQMDGALNKMISNQTQAGIKLQVIEIQDFNHQDYQLNVEKGRSNIQDLDFAVAISKFEQSKTALQAAQQTFVQVKNLSLFNYI